MAAQAREPSGPLIVAAGFATFLSTLQWTNFNVPWTVGQTLGSC
jgi:hypothetical protein